MSEDRCPVCAELGHTDCLRRVAADIRALHDIDALPLDKHFEWYVGWHRALERAARAAEPPEPKA